MPKNNSGFDNLSNQLLKKLLPAFLTPLEIIVNKSLSEGVSPTEIKTADVVPLFKSEKYNNSINYMPISLLLTMSKLLENIVYFLFALTNC